jgi:hypothetical protein
VWWLPLGGSDILWPLLITIIKSYLPGVQLWQQLMCAVALSSILLYSLKKTWVVNMLFQPRIYLSHLQGVFSHFSHSINKNLITFPFEHSMISLTEQVKKKKGDFFYHWCKIWVMLKKWNDRKKQWLSWLYNLQHGLLLEKNPTRKVKISEYMINTNSCKNLGTIAQTRRPYGVRSLTSPWLNRGQTPEK